MAGTRLGEYRPDKPEEHEQVTLSLPKSAMDRVRSLASKHGVTPEVFLSGYVELVAKPAPRPPRKRKG